MKNNNCVVISNKTIFAIVLLFAIIVAKLLYVAISPTVDGMDLKAFALTRTTAKKTIIANRGAIYDSIGETLAQDVRSYTVIAYLSSSRTTNLNNPKHVVDKQMTAEALSPLINMTVDNILKLLNQDKYQVELGPGGRGITELLKQKITALDIAGIGFIKSSKRDYPNGDFASYILGYARKSDETLEIAGEMGIELKYNSQLKGKNGSITYQKDAYGYQIANTPEFIDESQDGYDIYLTIDSNIQMYLENAINEIEKIGVNWATITIADANTGAIVGSSTSPSFNPNVLEITTYSNPLTSYVYEPGSTMKIFSFMAAIEEGLYNGSETYQSGSIQVDDYKISDWNRTGWGRISFDTGFTYSSNVAAVNLAQKLGKTKLIEYYEKFGFGSPTDIELPNEYNGKINVSYNTELASAAYGQGITTTPIQNIQALTSLTNKGIVLKPYIVSKIVNKATGQIVYSGQRTEVKRAVSEQTVSQMIELMDATVNSTDPAVTGKKYQTDAVRVIGKTGTAQYINTQGKYASGTNANIRSFAGIFPKEDPQYIIYLSLKQFQSDSNKMGSIITSIIESIAKYKNIDNITSSEDTTKLHIINNYINSKTSDVTASLTSNGLIPIVLGSGERIINQSISKNSKVISNTKIFLLTNGTDFLMPEVKGWGSSEIITLANMLSMKYNISGYGNVTSTSVSTGSPIDIKTTLEITLDNYGG